MSDDLRRSIAATMNLAATREWDLMMYGSHTIGATQMCPAGCGTEVGVVEHRDVTDPGRPDWSNLCEIQSLEGGTSPDQVVFTVHDGERCTAASADLRGRVQSLAEHNPPRMIWVDEDGSTRFQCMTDTPNPDCIGCREVGL